MHRCRATPAKHLFKCGFAVSFIDMRRLQMATKYTILFERDGHGWMASVKEVAGCRTGGRTIEQVRERIREALSTAVENAENAELVEELPRKIRNAVIMARGARAEAERKQEGA